MNNIDKYPDCPCYNCLVRSTCTIFKNISIKQRVECDIQGNIENIFFMACIEQCKCLKLYEYLVGIDQDEQLRFLSDIRFGTTETYITNYQENLRSQMYVK